MTVLMGRTYEYQLRQDNMAIVESGTLDNVATNLVETRGTVPGMLLLEIKGVDFNAEPQLAGLAVSPRRIAPSLRRAARFRSLLEGQDCAVTARAAGCAADSRQQ